MNPMFRFRLLLLSFLLMAGSAAIADHNHQQDETKIILGIHPYLPAEELVKRFSPLAAYLEAHMEVKVELQISRDYKTHVEHIANNALDIAFMGPSSYVTLTQQHGKHPLLARLEVNGAPYLYGDIIVSKKSGISDLKQLAGKRFAFGSPLSTMSYIVPRSMLSRSGVTLNHFAEYKFLGNHRNVALGVLLDKFDAGAVKENVFNEFKDQGLISIARTPAISEHLFVARKNFPVERVKAVRSLLLEVAQTKEGERVLRSIKPSITGLVSAKHSDYKSLADLM